MASDDKKIKTSPTPKNESPPKNKGTSDVSPSKAEGGEKTVDLSSNYSRGEGQKPVSKAYKDNWNAIYAKKKSNNLSSGAGITRVAAVRRSLKRWFSGPERSAAVVGSAKIQGISTQKQGL
jgi:hypothetical protein